MDRRARGRALLAVAAAVAGLACGDDTAPADGGVDATSDGADGGGEGAGPRLDDVSPRTAHAGTYLTLTGAGLAGAGAELLLDAEVVARHGAELTLGQCPVGRDHCVVVHAWTDERIVVVLPLGHDGGRFQIRDGAATSAAQAVVIDQVATATLHRGAWVDVFARDADRLVLARNEGARLHTRRVQAGMVATAYNLAVGDAMIGEPVVVASATEPGGFAVFAVGTVASVGHVFVGPPEGPLVDTGVASYKGNMPILAATDSAEGPVVWVASPDGDARFVHRQGRAWSFVDAPGKGFAWGGTSAQRAWATEPGGAIVGAIGIQKGDKGDFIYDLGYYRLYRDGAVATSTTELVVLDGDDSTQNVTIRWDGPSATPEIFHIETRYISMQTPLLRRRMADGTWSRTEAPVMPLFVVPFADGYGYLSSRYGTGPFGRTHVLELRRPSGAVDAVSGDLLTIFQDPIACLGLDGQGRPELVLRDRDPEVAPPVAGAHRWLRAR